MKEPRMQEYFSIKYWFPGGKIKIKSALDSYAQNKTDLSNVKYAKEFNIESKVRNYMEVLQ